MISYLHIPLIMAVVGAAQAISVPTGKMGPITPAKPLPIVVNPSAQAVGAPVWERVDETGSGFTPPIYNYILYDYVQKYGHHTLFPREEDYYHPGVAASHGKLVPPSYSKFYMSSKSPTSKLNSYYSPLNFL